MRRGDARNGAGKDVRARLVDAATEVFASDGYDNARIQDIAARAGCTSGAVYADFDGKADLLAAVITELCQGLLFDIVESLNADVPTRDMLLDLVARTQTGRKRPEHRILVDACAVAARDARVREVLLPIFAHAQGMLEALFDQAKRRGAIDPDLPRDALVHLATTLLLGSLFSRALELERPDRYDSRMLSRRLLGGLLPSSPLPSTPAYAD